MSLPSPFNYYGSWCLISECDTGTGFSEAVLEERSVSLREKVIPKPKVCVALFQFFVPSEDFLYMVLLILLLANSYILVNGRHIIAMQIQVIQIIQMYGLNPLRY